jgi:hypothetical protein
VLVAGEVDDPVDLAGGVPVPDERPGRVDLAVSPEMSKPASAASTSG